MTVFPPGGLEPRSLDRVESHNHQRAAVPVPSLVWGFAVEDDMHASGNPIDHSRDTYDRGHGGDQIGEEASSRPAPQHPRGRGRREAISSFVCSLAATRLQVTAEPVNDLCSFVRSRRTAAHGVCGGVTMHGAEGLPCGTLIAIDAPRWTITKRYRCRAAGLLPSAAGYRKITVVRRESTLSDIALRDRPRVVRLLRHHRPSSGL